MSLSLLLNNWVRIERPTVGRDGQRGKTQAAWTTLDDYRASLQPASAQVIEMYQQNNIQVDTTVFFEDDPATEPGDRITLIDREGGTSLGEVYMVEGGDRQLRGYVHCPFFVNCKRIK